MTNKLYIISDGWNQDSDMADLQKKRLSQVTAALFVCKTLLKILFCVMKPLSLCAKTTKYCSLFGIFTDIVKLILHYAKFPFNNINNNKKAPKAYK